MRCMGLEQKVRIIPHRVDSAAFSLSLDRALLKVMNAKVQRNEYVDPVLRTYQFSRPAVVMGFNQKVDGRFNEELANTLGVDLTVRDTGGGHMYFSPHDIHFAFIASRSLFRKNLIERYHAVNSIILNALRDSGYNAVFGRTSIRLDMHTHEKLLVGTAQRLASHTFLQHGAILITPYTSEIFALLMAREDEIHKWNDHVVSLGELGVSFYQQLPQRIASSFQNSYRSELTTYELAHAHQLYSDVYSRKDKIYSGTKHGDICLIAEELSTKDIEQEVAL